MKTRSESGRYPLCRSLGQLYRPLSVQEQATATADECIASILPFLITRASNFCDSLKGRQRSNYDLEDVLAEMYLELTAKHPKFNPDYNDGVKTRYITYAGKIVDHLLVAIRDAAGTVHSPKNSGYRLATYQETLEAGKLSPRQSSTAGKIKKTRLDYGVVDGSSLSHRATPDREAETNEDLRTAVDALMSGISRCSPYEAAAVGKRFGLWGQAESSLEDVAGEIGGDKARVSAAISSAKRKIRSVIEDSGHPYADE